MGFIFILQFIFLKYTTYFDTNRERIYDKKFNPP